MKYAFFRIPVDGEPTAVAELNDFLTRHRIRDVERRFVEVGDRSYWAVCVVWLESNSRPPALPGARERIDYREKLPPAEFAVFAALRELRKQLAQRDREAGVLVGRWSRREGSPALRSQFGTARCR